MNKINWNTVAAIASAVAALTALTMTIIAYRQLQDSSHFARETAELTSIQKLDTQWQSHHMIATRRKAAKALIEQRPNVDVDQVLDFFDEIVRLVEQGILSEKNAWHTFYWPMSNYFSASEAYIRDVQSREGSDTWHDLAIALDRFRKIELAESKQSKKQIYPTKEQTQEFLKDEENLTQ